MAEVECTKKPRESWMKPDHIKKKLEARGYKLELFKTLEYCYQITGTDKTGKVFDYYLDPTNAKIFKAK